MNFEPGDEVFVDDHEGVYVVSYVNEQFGLIRVERPGVTWSSKSVSKHLCELAVVRLMHDAMLKARCERR